MSGPREHQVYLPWARSVPEHLRNSKEASVPAEVGVRGQGVEDEAREAWGAAPCGLSGHPQVWAFILNDKESPRRALKRGGTGSNSHYKIMYVRCLLIGNYYLYSPAHFTSDKLRWSGGESSAFNIYYLCSCSCAMCCWELALMLIAFLRSLCRQIAFLYRTTQTPGLML